MIIVNFVVVVHGLLDASDAVFAAAAGAVATVVVVAVGAVSALVVIACKAGER